MAIFVLALLGFLRKSYMCTCIGIFCSGKCFGTNNIFDPFYSCDILSPLKISKNYLLERHSHPLVEILVRHKNFVRVHQFETLNKLLVHTAHSVRVMSFFLQIF